MLQPLQNIFITKWNFVCMFSVGKYFEKYETPFFWWSSELEVSFLTFFDKRLHWLINLFNWFTDIKWRKQHADITSECWIAIVDRWVQCQEWTMSFQWYVLKCFGMCYNVWYCGDRGHMEFRVTKLQDLTGLPNVLFLNLSFYIWNNTVRVDGFKNYFPICQIFLKYNSNII